MHDRLDHETCEAWGWHWQKEGKGYSSHPRGCDSLGGKRELNGTVEFQDLLAGGRLEASFSKHVASVEGREAASVVLAYINRSSSIRWLP
mmetsp:Transcript_2839/g.4033  ORF Transcript_2839/g.4033 Transcript_2839/m.4033 type:complete len:90 (-) Transcript_2839:482-751(-)